MESQAAEFFFDLQDFERLPSCFLGLDGERLQVLTEPPDNIKPAVAVDKAVHHASLAQIAVYLEPRRPAKSSGLRTIYGHLRSRLSGKNAERVPLYRISGFISFHC
jgi:hypothetical protein